MNSNLKNESGITLLALMVTIITLIILSGVTIFSVVNFNIVDNAATAKTKSDIKVVYEQLTEAINAKKLNGEDVTTLEIQLAELEKIKDAHPDLLEKIQNIDPAILSMLIISKGDIQYMDEKVAEYVGNDEAKKQEIIEYLKELGIELFTPLDVETKQQISEIFWTPGQEGTTGTKTIIEKTVTEYVYQISVILDLSSSMLWAYDYTGDDQSKFIYDYENETQRLYVAKQAINAFLDKFFEERTTGQVQVITFNADSAGNTSSSSSNNRWPGQNNNSSSYKGYMELINTGLNHSIATNATEAESLKTAVSDITLTTGLGTYYIGPLNLARTSLKTYFPTYSEEPVITRDESNPDEVVITETKYEVKPLIIFLSDGVPSPFGTYEESEYRTEVINKTNEIKRDYEIEIYTIGFTLDSDILSDMASVIKDENGNDKIMYFTASNMNALMSAFNEILEKTYVEPGTGGTTKIETKVTTATDREEQGSVSTEGYKNLVSYDIDGKLDRTGPIQICEPNADGGYTVLESHYVNNLPEYLIYDGNKVYWDLSKMSAELLAKKPILKFRVLTEQQATNTTDENTTIDDTNTTTN